MKMKWRCKAMGKGQGQRTSRYKEIVGERWDEATRI